MTKKEEFEEDIENAVKCAALEHNFFKDLRSDLRQLKIAVESAFIDSSVKGIKKAFRDAYYLSRAESREQKYLKNVESLLQKLKERMSKQAPIRELEHLDREIDLTIQRLDIEAGHLIRDASRYEGQIRTLLEHLETAVKDHELEKAHQIVMQVNEVVDDAEQWLAALSTDLTRAKKLSHEFEVVFHDSVEGVQEALAPLSDEAKADYVAYLLSSPKSLRRNVKAFLEQFAEEEKDRNREFSFAYHRADSKYTRRPGVTYTPEYLEREKTKKQLNQHLLMALKTGNPNTVLQVLRSIPKEYRRLLHAVTKGFESNHVNPIYTQLKSFALRSKSKELILEVAHLYEEDRYFMYDERIASELYAAVGEWEKAAELLGDCKDLDFGMKQARYYDLAGKFEKAREVRKKIAIYIAQHGVMGGWERNYKADAMKRKALPLLKQIGMSEKEAFLFLAEQQFDNHLNQRAYFYEQAEEWGLAAEVYKRLNNKKKENHCRDKAERLNKKKMGLVVQGDLYFQRGDFEKALKRYQKVEAWRQVGDTLSKLGRGLEAVQAYGKARLAEELRHQEDREERIQEEVREATGDASELRRKQRQRQEQSQ